MTDEAKKPVPEELDGVIAAPECHRLLHQHGSVRVVEVTVPPLLREVVHTHVAGGIMINQTTTRLIYERHEWDGEKLVFLDAKERTTRAGRVRWIESEPPHLLENLDDHEFRALRIEFLDEPGPEHWHEKSNNEM